MLKNWYLYSLLLFLSLLASCGREGRVNDRLEEIDTLLMEQADSADALLKGMAKEVDGLSEDTRMYYDLLRVKATDRSFGNHQTDSLIMRVVDYYEQHPEQKHLGEAYFYAGRVCAEVDNHAKRVLYYLELALMSDTTWLNDYWRSRILAQKGYMYQQNGLYEEAHDMAELARTYCQQIGDTMGVRICTEDIATVEEMSAMVPQDSASLVLLRQAIKGINEKARSKKIKLENDRLQQDTKPHGRTLVVLVAFFLCVLCGYIWWPKRRREVEPTKEAAPSEHDETPEPMRRNFYDPEVDELLQSRIKADKALRQSDWQTLEDHLLKSFPDFRTQLYAHYELSETEYRICLLIKMNVSPSNMARLLAMGNSSISQSRLRMQQKVFNGSGTAKDWDNYIQSL